MDERGEGAGTFGPFPAPAWEIRPDRGTGAFEMVMVTLGVLTLAFAIAALIAETVWALLVPAMAGLVLMWALAILHDAGYIAREPAAGHG